MKHPLPTRKLPERPNLDQLKRQAKELLEAFTAGEAAAVAEVNRYYRDADAATFALHDAQLVLTRSYGFDSWPKIKAYVDGMTVEQLTRAVRANDVAGVHSILRIRPELVNVMMAWNNEHTALHLAVLGRMPEMVRVLMEHGAMPAKASPRITKRRVLSRLHASAGTTRSRTSSEKRKIAAIRDDRQRTNYLQNCGKR